ncbi:TetR/AcrR family transcriptional regulator [Nocardia xishanensis]
MGRPPKHDADRLLDAAAELLAAGGPAAITMSAVAKAVGAPSGSVYHRFPDRPALLAALWSRALHRFHEELLAVLTIERPEEAIRRGARATLDWALRNPRDAAVLLAGAGDLGERDWSRQAREDTARANAAIQDALTELIARTGDTGPQATDRMLLAAVDLPYALVRRYLRAGQQIPPHAADLAEQAAAALIGANDRSATD